jgi:hypothetical protein
LAARTDAVRSLDEPQICGIAFRFKKPVSSQVIRKNVRDAWALTRHHASSNNLQAAF